MLDLLASAVAQCYGTLYKQACFSCLRPFVTMAPCRARSHSMCQAVLETGTAELVGELFLRFFRPRLRAMINGEALHFSSYSVFACTVVI